MIYSEKYKVELEDIGISNKISNKRIITIMEDVAAATFRFSRFWSERCKKKTTVHGFY